MLTNYPVLDADAVARQGESWLACDVASCNKTVKVEGDVLPSGWVTDDPDDNPHRGAAQFCSTHSSRVSVGPDEVAPAPEPPAPSG